MVISHLKRHPAASWIASLLAHLARSSGPHRCRSFGRRLCEWGGDRSVGLAGLVLAWGHAGALLHPSSPIILAASKGQGLPDVAESFAIRLCYHYVLPMISQRYLAGSIVIPCTYFTYSWVDAAKLQPVDSRAAFRLRGGGPVLGVRIGGRTGRVRARVPEECRPPRH